MTRVAVLGALGRMGSLSAAAIEAAADLELISRIDLGDDLNTLLDQGVDVALDFTSPEAAVANIEWAVTNGINVVVGTSGFDQDKIDKVTALVGDKDVSVLIVPNFSIGAVLMMKFAQIAAPYFESTEIIEVHHPDKIDAPSGTAIRSAQLIAQARDRAGLGAVPDATTSDPAGARGGKVAGIPVHAIRARGYVASQEVLFGGLGETLAIRHDSNDRVSFMPGVIAALKAAPNLRGVHVGLESILGI